MRLLRAAVPAFALSCLAALVASACGSSKGSGVSGASSGNGSGADGSGASSNSSGGSVNIDDPQLGLGGDSLETPVVGGAGAIDACAGDSIQAERIPLDMYVMLDVSGSMLEATVGDANTTKWTAVSSALTDFVSDPKSDGLGMGLQVFPITNNDAPASCTADTECGTYGPCLNRSCWPLNNGLLVGCLSDDNCDLNQTCKVIGECSKNTQYACDFAVSAVCGANRGDCVPPSSVCLSTTDCRPATYQSPAAPIAMLPMGRDAIIKVIGNSTPEEGALTPTGPALTGAVQQAAAWAKAHTDHQVVAVLATDGLPTLKTSGKVCAPVETLTDINAVVNIAGSAARSQPSISTFVIGVVGPDDIDAGATDILDAIAVAGDTQQSFIVNTQGNVQTEFRNALNSIRQAGLSCDLAIPKPGAGEKLDYNLVNVSFDDGSGAKTLGNVKSEADCGNEPRWYYDVDPAVGAPTRILTCPAACDAFQKTDMGSVKIVLGCETKVVVK